MSGPWAKSETCIPGTTSLRDVMQEQESQNQEDDDLTRALQESLEIAENAKS